MRPAPTFSVVIAAYRAEATIAEAIESALNQSLPPTEVVVVDDGSPDAQWDVIERYGTSVRAVRLRHNCGEPMARRAAVEAASAEWVVMLDADDVWLPGRLAALAERCVAARGSVIVTSNAWVEPASGAHWRYYDRIAWPQGDQREAILRKNFVFGNAAVRREDWLETCAGIDLRRAPYLDYPMWVSLILRGARAELVDEPLVRYRPREGSMSSSLAVRLTARKVAMRLALATPGLTRPERALARRRLVRTQMTTAFLAATSSARTRFDRRG